MLVPVSQSSQSVPVFFCARDPIVSIQRVECVLWALAVALLPVSVVQHGGVG